MWALTTASAVAAARHSESNSSICNTSNSNSRASAGSSRLPPLPPPLSIPTSPSPPRCRPRLGPVHPPAAKLSASSSSLCPPAAARGPLSPPLTSTLRAHQQQPAFKLKTSGASALQQACSKKGAVSQAPPAAAALWAGNSGAASGIFEVVHKVARRSMETKWARFGSLTVARCGGAVLLLCALLLLAGSQVDAHQSGGSPGFDPVSPNAQQQHFVLVHGIGHGAWCWYKVITFLRLRGYQVSAVDLTGAGINRVVPAENVTTVAQYTQPLIDLLASLPPSEKVILVGHSLGGGSIAYASELFPDKVSKAVYVAAGSPTYNDSFATSFAPTTFPRLLGAGDLYANFPDGPDQPARSFSLNRTTLRDFFYNTSPLKDYYLALTLLTTSPALIVNEVLPLTPQNFGTVPRYYIQTLADFGVATSEQAYIIARNPPLCVFQIPGADHAVFFSKPKPLSRLLILVSELDPQSGRCRPVSS